MKISDYFHSENLKRSNNREALTRVLRKLEKTKNEIVKTLKADGSETKIKFLKLRLQTNKQQQSKVKRLLTELG